MPHVTPIALMGLAPVVAAMSTAAAERAAPHFPLYPDCAPGMTCVQLRVMAKDLGREQTFDCAKVSASMPSKGNVLLVHGNDGPKSKAMWALTMLSFASKGYNALACDMRGFSPGASPNASTAYNYDYLVARPTRSGASWPAGVCGVTSADSLLLTP